MTPTGCTDRDCHGGRPNQQRMRHSRGRRQVEDRQVRRQACCQRPSRGLRAWALMTPTQLSDQSDRFSPDAVITPFELVMP